MNRIILEKDFVILYDKNLEKNISVSSLACRNNYKPLDINCQKIRKQCLGCILNSFVNKWQISDEEINICLRKKKLEKLLSI